MGEMGWGGGRTWEFSVKSYVEIWRGGGGLLSALYASESGMGF